MKEKQKEVDDWISEHGGYWPPLSMFARLMEEVGEFSREINLVYGMKKRKSEERIKSMEDEMGDVLFVLMCFGNYFKMDLDKVFSDTMEKVGGRL
ncbi:nucleotide pyrophosphohydrolase [archaeon]|nr:nucleotide pyrophosphohydrolase [archaeon]